MLKKLTGYFAFLVLYFSMLTISSANLPIDEVLPLPKFRDTIELKSFYHDDFSSKEMKMAFDSLLKASAESDLTKTLDLLNQVTQKQDNDIFLAHLLLGHIYANQKLHLDGQRAYYHLTIASQASGEFDRYNTIAPYAKLRRGYMLYDGTLIEQNKPKALAILNVSFKNNPDVRALFQNLADVLEHNTTLASQTGQYYPYINRFDYKMNAVDVFYYLAEAEFDAFLENNGVEAANPINPFVLEKLTKLNLKANQHLIDIIEKRPNFMTDTLELLNYAQTKSPQLNNFKKNYELSLRYDAFALRWARIRTYFDNEYKIFYKYDDSVSIYPPGEEPRKLRSQIAQRYLNHLESLHQLMQFNYPEAIIMHVKHPYEEVNVEDETIKNEIEYYSDKSAIIELLEQAIIMGSDEALGLISAYLLEHAKSDKEKIEAKEFLTLACHTGIEFTLCIENKDLLDDFIVINNVQIHPFHALKSVERILTDKYY